MDMDMDLEGSDGGLSTMGPLDSWSNKGSMALGLSKVPPCWVHVYVVGLMEVSKIIDQLALGQNVYLT